MGTGDRTTLSTIPAEATCVADVVAKQELVLAGVGFFIRVYELLDTAVTIHRLVEDGAWVETGAVVARLEGPTRSVLVGERTALNVLQRLSGVATLTRRYVDAIAGHDARIIDTRKTTPGMRTMEKYAVRMGGGANHRFGLDSGILIKDNHIAACASVFEAVRLARRDHPHLLRIEVEVSDLGALREALEAGADVVMLDNMDLASMGEAVRLVRSTGSGVVLEASGNLNLDRVAEVAATGVDLLSVGALTHSAPAMDLSMRIVS